MSVASNKSIAIRSKMRHCRRCERRFEIAFITGPVAPRIISRAPVLSVSLLIPVVCVSLLLFTVRTISYINERTKNVEYVLVRRCATLLLAHTHGWFARPSSALRIAVPLTAPWYGTCAARPGRLMLYRVLLPWLPHYVDRYTAQHQFLLLAS